MLGCRITNAVRCVPPANKPLGAEINHCNDYLAGELRTFAGLKAILALGRIAHQAVIKGLGLAQRDYPFAHGAQHRLPDGRLLVNSYHCSRYNLNTGRLTEEMFRGVFRQMEMILEST